jgi:hypothetical protein
VVTSWRAVVGVALDVDEPEQPASTPQPMTATITAAERRGGCGFTLSHLVLGKAGTAVRWRPPSTFGDSPPLFSQPAPLSCLAQKPVRNLPAAGTHSYCHPAAPERRRR